MKFSDEEVFLLMLMWLDENKVLGKFKRNYFNQELEANMWWFDKSGSKFACSISNAFRWRLSPEGFSFWADLNAKWCRIKAENNL